MKNSHRRFIALDIIDYYHGLEAMDIDMKKFGRHLARLRRRVLINDGLLTQEKLADKLGLSTQQIRKYEKGVDKPSPLTLRKLASIFAVSGDTLLLLKEGSLQMNYDLLIPVHKEQIKENIKLLMTMEGRQWEEGEASKISSGGQREPKKGKAS